MLLAPGSIIQSDLIPLAESLNAQLAESSSKSNIQVLTEFIYKLVKSIVTSPDDLVSFGQAAKLRHCSTKTIQRKVNSGELAVYGEMRLISKTQLMMIDIESRNKRGKSVKSNQSKISIRSKDIFSGAYLNSVRNDSVESLKEVNKVDTNTLPTIE